MLSNAIHQSVFWILKPEVTSVLLLQNSAADLFLFGIAFLHKDNEADVKTPN